MGKIEACTCRLPSPCKLRIVRIYDPHQGKYTMVHFAAMYGMKRVLAHVIDGLSDIEDESKITCPAEIIGIVPGPV